MTTTVAQLIEFLRQFPQDAEVDVLAGWSNGDYMGDSHGRQLREVGMDAYRDDWEGKDWPAVAEDFLEYSSRERAATLIPEPEQVILAAYTYEDYSGDAWVVFRQGPKFYEVNGGHCSCYGLEGQFDPEEYQDAQTFLAVLERRNDAYGIAGKYRAEVISAVRGFAGIP